MVGLFTSCIDHPIPCERSAQVARAPSAAASNPVQRFDGIEYMRCARMRIPQSELELVFPRSNLSAAK